MILNDLSQGDVVSQQIHLGGDRNFSYLFGDRISGEAAIVDPGFSPDDLLARVKAEDLTLKHILITHGHADHVGGLEQILAESGAMVAQTSIQLGERPLIRIETPGHAPDHLCWLYQGFLATGDLLFCGKVGGTGPYFPGSSAEEEWASLHRILDLPNETVVLPGHDYYGGEGVMPHSTIGHERAHNPFLLCADLAAFVHLKENWAAYKEEHGVR